MLLRRRAGVSRPQIPSIKKTGGHLARLGEVQKG
uniref:HTH_Tnp_Tc3_1 domain-containing protein n=1 Tax=Steinernema glaseri TaxID=37863 RepID=A0A1I8AT14_9BILA